ncbi:hypothetical protein [Vibrio vulnificus]|nr:hypothetical protein [Vibrio vulnificus]
MSYNRIKQQSHKEADNWSESLYPLPTYADLKKAKVVLEERNHG